MPKYTRAMLSPPTKNLKLLFDRIFEILDDNNAVEESHA